MDFSYQGRHPPPQLAAMVAQLNDGFETQDWIADSGANTHVTADSSNIANPQPFDGGDTVGVGNGAGLSIKILVHRWFMANPPPYLPFFSKISFTVRMPRPISFPLTNFA
jgi:hypothetical protein